MKGRNVVDCTGCRGASGATIRLIVSSDDEEGNLLYLHYKCDECKRIIVERYRLIDRIGTQAFEGEKIPGPPHAEDGE